MPGRLIIVCGLPGAGKTTVARRMAMDAAGVRFCPDEWMEALGVNLWDEAFRARVETLQWDVALGVLAGGGTAVIEWGTWTRRERDALLAAARQVGAAAELHFLDAADEVLAARIAARNREDPPITAADLGQWRLLFQAPDAGELAGYDVGIGPVDIAAL